MFFRAWAAELPGVVLPGRRAGEVMAARCPAKVKGGGKDSEAAALGSPLEAGAGAEGMMWIEGGAEALGWA